MSPADLASIDRANERAIDMADFLAAHPEWRAPPPPAPVAETPQ